jgi:hypothetical protein
LIPEAYSLGSRLGLHGVCFRYWRPVKKSFVFP